MITDNQLYTLAIFLGSAAMLMIVLYHFLEVNASDYDTPSSAEKSEKDTARTAAEKKEKVETD